MKSVNVLFGIAVGLIAGYFIALYAVEYILLAFTNHAEVLTVLGGLALLLIVLAYLVYDKVIAFIFKGSKASATQVIEGFANAVGKIFLPTDKEKQDALAGAMRTPVAMYASWSARLLIFQSLVGISVVFAGAIATAVLIKQNEILNAQLGKLDDQNSNLTRQNDLLVAQVDASQEQVRFLGRQNTLVQRQMILQQADRFAPLNALVSDLLQEIAAQTEKMKEQRDKLSQSQTNGSSSLLVLPSGITEKIKTVLRQLEPYAFLSITPIDPEQEIFDEKVVFLSPERGQILRALILEDIDISRLGKADFSYADMRNYDGTTAAFFDYAYENPYPCGENEQDLSALNLKHSDFSGANLVWMNFQIQEGMRFGGLRLQQSMLEIESGLKVPLSQVVMIETGLTVNPNSAVSLRGAQIETDVGYLESSCIGSFYNSDTVTIDEIGIIDVSGAEIEMYSNVDIVDRETGSTTDFYSDSEYEIIRQIFSEKDGNYDLKKKEIEHIFSSGSVITSDGDVFTPEAMRTYEPSGTAEIVFAEDGAQVIRFKFD